MGTLCMVLSMLVHQGETVLVKEHGKRHGSGGMLFNAVICLFSAVFFLLTDRNGFHFPGKLLVYGGISAIGIIKKEQQLFFGGACDNEFMLLSLAMSLS